MHDDDIYTHDGETYTNGAYYPKKPEDQVVEDDKTDAVIAQSYPVIKDVADWFQREIAAASDIHNIQVSVMTMNGFKYSRTVSVEAQVLAYQLLQEKLAEKFQEFEMFAKDMAADEEIINE